MGIIGVTALSVYISAYHWLIVSLHCLNSASMLKRQMGERQQPANVWLSDAEDGIYLRKRDARTKRLRQRRARDKWLPQYPIGNHVAVHRGMEWGSLKPVLKAVFNTGYPTVFGPVRGFVSDQHPLFRQFVKSLPRAIKRKVGVEGDLPQRLLSGSTKAQVGVGDSKMLALYQKYVCLNGSKRSWMRIDIDKSYSSIANLIEAIAGAGVPPPNIVVCQNSSCERIERPHFYYAINAPVCFTESGSDKAKRLFRAIEDCLTEQLVPVGADVRGLSNPLRGKNPLSPFWQTHILVDEPYQLSSGNNKAKLNLVALGSCLKLDDFLKRKFHQQVELANKLVAVPASQSNSLFDRVRFYAYSIKGDYSASNCRDEFAAAVAAFAEAQFEPDHAVQAARVAQNISDWTWLNYQKQATGHSRAGRGRLSESCRGKCLSERQAIGGSATGALRREKSVARLVEAVLATWAAGEVPFNTFPTDKVLAAAAGCSTRTIGRCRAAVKGELLKHDRRCIDKKLPCALVDVGVASEVSQALTSNEENLSGGRPNQPFLLPLVTPFDEPTFGPIDRGACKRNQRTASLKIVAKKTMTFLIDADQTPTQVDSKRTLPAEISGRIGLPASRHHGLAGRAEWSGSSSQGGADERTGAREVGQQRTTPSPRAARQSPRAALPPAITAFDGRVLPPEVAVGRCLPDLNVSAVGRCLRFGRDANEKPGASLEKVFDSAATYLAANPEKSCAKVTAEQVRTAFLKPKDSANSSSTLQTADLLILVLPADEPLLRRDGSPIAYGRPIQDLLWKREDKRLITWIWTRWDPEDEAFLRRYGLDMTIHITQFFYFDASKIEDLWMSSSAYQAKIEEARRQSDEDAFLKQEEDERSECRSKNSGGMMDAIYRRVDFQSPGLARYYSSWNNAHAADYDFGGDAKDDEEDAEEDAEEVA